MKQWWAVAEGGVGIERYKKRHMVSVVGKCLMTSHGINLNSRTC